MSATVSRTITRIEKEGRSVADSGKANAAKVAEVLDQRLLPILPEGQPRPDFVAFQLGLAQLVDHGREALLAHDGTYVDELVDDFVGRFERDTAQDELSQVLENVRSAWQGVYGELAIRTLFGDVSQLPQDPVELHRVGKHVHGRLTAEGFSPPEVRLPGQSLDHAQLAATLGERVERLGRALGSMSIERKGSDLGLSAKSGAIDEYRATVRWVGRCLAALYLLAGFDDLAAKVLPKRRAPRRRRAPEDGGEPQNNGQTATPESGSPDGGPREGSSPDEAAPASGPLGIVS